MPIRITQYPYYRRLLRRVSQSWVIEAITGVLKRKAIRMGMAQRWCDGSTARLFDDVEIETINKCNGRCTFCPVNAGVDSRVEAIMEDDLFSKLVGELGDIGYSGRIGLSSNNEPFLDKNIIERIAHARASCPRARLYLYTNGTLLNLDKALSALRAGLDILVIDDYSDDLVMSKNTARILQGLNRPEHAREAWQVEVFVRKRTESLRNRAGRAPNKSCQTSQVFKLYASAGCVSPFKQLVIRPTGHVSLCCNDALGEVTLGDVGLDGLLGVWHGAAFTRVRRQLMTHGRRSLPLCAACDMPCYGLLDAVGLVLGRQKTGAEWISPRGAGGK